MIEYRLVIDDSGQATITTLSGEPISYREFQAILLTLSDARRHYRMTYADEFATPDDVIRAFPSTRLEYPFNHFWAIRFPYQGKRPNDAPVFTGVYIVSTVEYPEFVKIGRTKDLYKRSLEWSSAKSPFYRQRVTYTPVAFFHTPEHSAIEGLIHLKFASARQHGNEWFARKPVEEWLNSYKGLAP